MTMKRTYRLRTVSRGTEEMPASDLVWTETLDWGARTTTVHVTGRQGNERVDERSVTPWDKLRQLTGRSFPDPTPKQSDAYRKKLGYTLISVE